jgi:hypothetical protein
MMGQVWAAHLPEPPVRRVIMFRFCLTCERIADATRCSQNHEVAVIPPPPVDPRMN